MNKLVKILNQSDTPAIQRAFELQSLHLKLKTTSLNTGGGRRSANNGLVATVFGCTGFVGRYLVNNLVRKGVTVVVPYRGVEDDVRHLKNLGDLGKVVPMAFQLESFTQVLQCVESSHCVVNLIGRDYDTSNYTQLQSNAEGAATIARACRQANAPKFVHVSCINANSQAKKSFIQTKGVGEELVRSESGNRCIIVRPSTIFGLEDRFIQPIGKFSAMAPAIPILKPASQIKYPTYVGDVAEAIGRIVCSEEIVATGQIYELCGPLEMTYGEVVQMVVKYSMRQAKPVIHLPKQLYWLYSTLLRSWFSPVHRSSQLDWLLQSEQRSQNVLGYEALNMQPSSLEQMAIGMCRLYRDFEHSHDIRLNIGKQ